HRPLHLSSLHSFPTRRSSDLSGVTEIVRNYAKDRFGTKVPFSGTFEHPQPDIFATIFNAFRNAFVKAFEGKLENKKLPPVKPERSEEHTSELQSLAYLVCRLL